MFVCANDIRISDELRLHAVCHELHARVAYHALRRREVHRGDRRDGRRPESA